MLSVIKNKCSKLKNNNQTPTGRTLFLPMWLQLGKDIKYMYYNDPTVKLLNVRTPQKFAVITLKFEQDGFTKE